MKCKMTAVTDDDDVAGLGQKPFFFKCFVTVKCFLRKMFIEKQLAWLVTNICARSISIVSISAIAIKSAIELKREKAEGKHVDEWICVLLFVAVCSAVLNVTGTMILTDFT